MQTTRNGWLDTINATLLDDGTNACLKVQVPIYVHVLIGIETAVCQLNSNR